MFSRTRFSQASYKLPRSKYQPQEYKGAPYDEVIKLRNKFVNPCHRRYFSLPLLVSDANMQYLWDEKGHQYLDLFGSGGAIACGHCHPHVAEAVRKQADTLMHSSSLYAIPVQYRLLETINDYLPKGDWVYHFTNSQSEATEFALFTARSYTQRSHLVALESGYFESSLQGTEKSARVSLDVLRAEAPVEYRGSFGTDTKKYLANLRETIEKAPDGQIAAYIADAVNCEGGLYPVLPHYFSKAYPLIREKGGLCIASENITGWGRLGDSFWGFKHHGVVPDIITFGSSVSDGAPMGLVAVKRAIAEKVEVPGYFDSMGGSPLSCAAALANLQVLKSEGFQERCRVVGNHLRGIVEDLQSSYPIIGNVRGSGMLTAIELVEPGGQSPLDRELVYSVLGSLMTRGIIVGGGGVHDNVLRIQGPMCITIEDADYFGEQFEGVLQSLGDVKNKSKNKGADKEPL